ncbi:MAG: hypothetical protein QM813_00150 [Verrucomicrobiota bacterium]
MNQPDAEAELGWRLYLWARESITREVVEDFPLLRLCQHERRISCRLAWIAELPESQRLPVCLALVKCANRPALGKREQLTEQDEEVLNWADEAYLRFHDALPPTPDTDRSCSTFIKGDLRRGRDLIIESMDQVLGTPSKRSAKMLWYVHLHGEWIHKCIIKLRSPHCSGMVECQNFLWRSDFNFHTQPDDIIQNINVLGRLGVGTWGLPLVSSSQEQLSAKAVTAIARHFANAVPSLVQGLQKNH